MALTPEQEKEILDAAFEHMKDTVIKTAVSSTSWKIEHELKEAVASIVTKFVADEIAPEILVSLNEQKSAIVQAAIVSADKLAVMLAESLTAKLAENLGRSYRRDEIFKKMFE